MPNPKDNLKERLARVPPNQDQRDRQEVRANNLHSRVVQFGAGGLLKVRKGTVADGQTDHYVF